MSVVVLTRPRQTSMIWLGRSSEDCHIFDIPVKSAAKDNWTHRSGSNKCFKFKNIGVLWELLFSHLQGKPTWYGWDGVLTIAIFLTSLLSLTQKTFQRIVQVLVNVLKSKISESNESCGSHTSKGNLHDMAGTEFWRLPYFWHPCSVWHKRHFNASSRF